MDASEFRTAAKQLVDYIADYIENIRERPVLPSVEPGYIRDLVPGSPPEEGQTWEEVYQDIERVVMPGVSFTNELNNFSLTRYSHTSTRVYEYK